MPELAVVGTPSPWHVYALVLRNGAIYMGASNNVEKRIAEHARGVGSKCTRSGRPVKHLATSEAMSRLEALRLEAALKQLPRARKLVWVEAHAVVAPPVLERLQAKLRWEACG